MAGKAGMTLPEVHYICGGDVEYCHWGESHCSRHLDVRVRVREDSVPRDSSL